ncbi:MAG: hypothetical protein P1V36_01730 [Planctomycetota bacterium]|nr:hypothetical protein [Planctomycetota bacterium]
MEGDVVIFRTLRGSSYILNMRGDYLYFENGSDAWIERHGLRPARLCGRTGHGIDGWVTEIRHEDGTTWEWAGTWERA